MLKEQSAAKAKKEASTGTNTLPKAKILSEAVLRQRIEELAAERDHLLQRDRALNDDLHNRLMKERAKARRFKSPGNLFYD